MMLAMDFLLSVSCNQQWTARPSRRGSSPPRPRSLAGVMKARPVRVFLCAPPFEAALAPGPVTLLEAALTLPLATFRIADDRALQLTMPPYDHAIPPCSTRASRSRGGSVSPRTHAWRGVLR